MTDQAVTEKTRLSDVVTSQSSYKSIWKIEAFIILMLVVFWPVGVVLMWKYATWRKRIKLGLSIFFAFGWAILLILAFVLLFSVSLIGSKVDSPYESTSEGNTQSQSKQYQVDSYTFEQTAGGNTVIVNKNNGITFQIPQGIQYQTVTSLSGDKEGKPPPDKQLAIYADGKRKLYNQAFVTLDIYPDPDGGIWTSHKNLRGAISGTIGGLEAVKFTNDDSGEILYVHKSNTVFWFELRADPKYFGYGGKPLSDQEKAKNHEAFDMIKATFRNTE